MTTPAPKPRRARTVRFSPVLLAVALTPVFLQTSTISCRRGDARLSELAIIVEGVDQLVGFDSDQRNYEIVVPLETTEALVHAIPTDPRSQVFVDVVMQGGTSTRYMNGVVGGGDVSVPIPADIYSIAVFAKAPLGATDAYGVGVAFAPVFPCTEQGILDAIAAGGGPHTFDCDGPTTVVTEGEIIIDNDVVLDGEGNLTIDGNDDHRVVWVEAGVTVELNGMTVSGGFVDDADGAGIRNEGTLTITDSIIEDNTAVSPYAGVGSGGGIYNTGTLDVLNSVIRYNSDVADQFNMSQGSGIYNTGTVTLLSSDVSENYGYESCVFSTGILTLIDSQVSYNSSGDGAAITASGTLVVSNSTVQHGFYEVIVSGGATTVTNSTVTSGGGYFPVILHSGEALTLLSSTVVQDSGSLAFATIDGSYGSDVRVANSLIVGTEGLSDFTCSGNIISLGGNIESPSNDCGFTEPTDLVSVSTDDLKLGPLADNGGPTVTRALLPGSVAIDWISEADCVDADRQPLTTDQRGVARPQGGACDVGAFEWADCSGTACDDGNDCTADYCDPSDDSWCVDNALPDGTLCSVGTCLGGVCTGGADADPPVLTSFDFNPKQVDVSTQDQVVTCTIGLSDVGTGAYYTHCVFKNGGQLRNCGPFAFSPISGDAFDGTWSCDVTIPVGSAEGAWTAQVIAYDQVGNQATYYTQDLQDAGYPAQLDVIY